MPRQEFDKSSKWLVQHHGKAILHLGGARGVRSCRALQAEVVQPRQLPDGLLEVTFQGRKKPDHVLVEVATYPEKRVVKQALNDLSLASQQLPELPDLLVVVLHPKGKVRVEGSLELRGRLGWSRLAGGWKVVELWTLDAEELLAAGDVGLVPWVPLTRFEGRPEPVLERCRQLISERAHPEDRANLLAVSQVLAELRFKDPQLLSLLGGRQVMIESPLIKELQAQTLHEAIIELLQARFGEVPLEVTTRLGKILKLKRLRELNVHAGTCPDVEAFRAQLLS